MCGEISGETMFLYGCHLIYRSFSPSGTTYATQKSITNPTNLGSIGLLTTFEVTFQRSGPTYIPSLTLTLSLPLGGSDWSSYYLYPASVVMFSPHFCVPCCNHICCGLAIGQQCTHHSRHLCLGCVESLQPPNH